MKFILLHRGEGSATTLARAAERLPDLQVVISDPGTLLLTETAASILSLGDGVILGEVFSHSSGKRVTALSTDQQSKILASRGAGLCDDVWGAYVAILRDRDRDRLDILRDPSGFVPVYRLIVEDVEVLTSDLALVEKGLGYRPRLAWDGITQMLAYPQLPGRATGLQGVSEIPAGALLSWQGKRATETQLWSPWTFAGRSRRIDDIAVARELLRRTLERVVRLWAEVYPSALLELSGGLDSSLVGLCLPYGPTISAINIVTPSAEGDERDYARLSADAARLSLIEALVEPYANFRHARIGRFPRPSSHGYLQAIETKIAEIGRERGVSAFFSGKGGDNVLCDIKTAGPGADALLTFGFSGRSLSALADLTRVHGCTFWTAVRLSAKKALRGSRAVSAQTLFLKHDVRATIPDHPWHAAQPGILPGKRDHLRSLLLAHAFLDRYAHAADGPVIAPMLSQPMVELCLRIPTWMWVDGGQGRAVARQAFASRLPERVRQRTTKGSLDGFAAAVYRHARKDLAAFLLEGCIAKAGLIDIPALAQALDQDRQSSAVLTRIFQLADTEAWAATWD